MGLGLSFFWKPLYICSLKTWNEMYYIIYLSTATELFEEQELEEILKTSRRNNSENDVTGILLYLDGSIIQVLEGEESTVKELYQKILLDRRHTGAIKLKEGTLEKRNFPDWSMGYQKLSHSEVKNLIGQKNLSDLTFYPTDENGKHPAMVVLRSFMKNLRY